MKEVLVLGGTGMLGSMVVDVLSREKGLRVRATARDAETARRFAGRAPEVGWTTYDANRDPAERLSRVLNGAGCVVNCIGITKPYAHDGNGEETLRAIQLNAAMPFVLARAAEHSGARVVQIATDCVYSGRKGQYRESDPQDAADVYGKTKSLGEVRSKRVHQLRVSIIGPEPKAFVFLLEWFRRQAAGSRVKGFANHRWNGVTTLHFARLCAGIIREELAPSRPQHVIPAEAVTKLALLRCLAGAFRRGDVEIESCEAGETIDRTLATEYPGANWALWTAAGYAEPPSIGRMVEELAGFDYRFAGI